MNFEVIITPSAKADIFENNTWLLEHHPDTAERWLWRIIECITSLSKMPARCPISDESSAFEVEVRHLFCGEKPHVHRILFSIMETKVYILRVRSTKQKPLKEPS